MTETIEATFDGEVFRPENPVRFKPVWSVPLSFAIVASLSQKSNGLFACLSGVLLTVCV
jgi:hypothetical protein